MVVIFHVTLVMYRITPLRISIVGFKGVLHLQNSELYIFYTSIAYRCDFQNIIFFFALISTQI